MIDHVSIAVRDLDASAEFYDPVLQALGMTRLVTRDGTLGYGKRYPEFWLNRRTTVSVGGQDTGFHIALRARSREAVEQFHAIALARGGSCDGPPGPRQAAMTAYFGAFIRDPDGNKIEVLTFPPTEAG
jgi:catechol 2,3-dioxygenase-like lactoylglutathione lyase family enzyme